MDVGGLYLSLYLLLYRLVPQLARIAPLLTYGCASGQGLACEKSHELKMHHGLSDKQFRLSIYEAELEGELYWTVEENWEREILTVGMISGRAVGYPGKGDRLTRSAGDMTIDWVGCRYWEIQTISNPLGPSTVLTTPHHRSRQANR